MTLRMQRSPPNKGSTSILSFPNLKGVKQETAMGDFAQMRRFRIGLLSMTMFERPEALTAESANLNLR